VLDIPVVLTEQYPRGLGPTVQEVKDCLGDNYKPYEKITFSVMQSFVLRRKTANAI